MRRLHEGLDYKLYQIYIWGGLFLVAANILVRALTVEEADLATKRMFLVLLGPFLIWFAGVLLYWWWVFLFKGNRDLRRLSQAQHQGVPGIKALKSWSTLHQAMSLHGGNVRELIKSDRRAKRPVLLWYGCMNLGALWVAVPVVAGSLEIVEISGGAWLAGMVFWIALLLVGTPILVGWGGRSAEKAYLAPLGLAVTRTPGLTVDVLALIGDGQRLIPEGPAIVEGERYGRLVHIETIDKDSLTVLQASIPDFRVRSDDGKLVPEEGAPEAVKKALRSLRRAKRWRGIAVYAGSEGIAVQRESPGTNMWLYDLWLAEYLLENANRTASTS
jgi:hypothetical protein